MSSRTVTAVLDAPKEQVFDYLSRIENLPDWATEFARELKYEDGKAKVVNGLGEFYFTIEADPETGVIDMFAGPAEDELALFPTRVVELPAGEAPTASPCSGRRRCRTSSSSRSTSRFCASSRTSAARSRDRQGRPRLPAGEGGAALERAPRSALRRRGLGGRQPLVRLGARAALRGGRAAHGRARAAGAPEQAGDDRARPPARARRPRGATPRPDRRACLDRLPHRARPGLRAGRRDDARGARRARAATTWTTGRSTS